MTTQCQWATPRAFTPISFSNSSRLAYLVHVSSRGNLPEPFRDASWKGMSLESAGAKLFLQGTNGLLPSSTAFSISFFFIRRKLLVMPLLPVVTCI